jgi:lipopolysaccharide/colanic/teichoic acid biosynthesis glycosyltransferase
MVRNPDKKLLHKNPFMKSSAFNQSMNLVVIHQNRNFSPNNTKYLLRFVVCSEPLANITLSCLNGNSYPRSNNETIAIPQDWAGQTTKGKSGIIYYKDKVPVSLMSTSWFKAKQWFIVSNGGFVTRIDHQWLRKVLAQLRADVVAVNVSPQLQAGHEKVLVNSQGKLIGFRRFYNDLTQPAPIPGDWPHHLFIKTDILKKLLIDDTLPLSFTKLIDNCLSNSLKVRSLNIGGTVSDLGTEEGLLGFLATRLNSSAKNHRTLSSGYLDRDGIEISPGARLFGKILFGQNVSIGPNAIIVGPTIIGNGVNIAKGAVVIASIVDSGVSVPQNSIVQNRVLIKGQKNQKQAKQAKTNCMAVITNGIAAYKNSCVNNFRTWPRFSYARCAKRIADIVTSAGTLILFAPFFPIIAMVIKLTSRGPVFFKDARQGLYGKAFKCLKFRTMAVGADNLQDKLRILNQADGPQFKMADDPRLNTVGIFLRDTYIDEIPQFLNVLLGQMSVVGPRPSPESENTLCPSWRDARLSVRPGITGLWQVCRTRQPMKDFQEWIHYDTEYVRNLSLRMDLWICWHTAKKLVKNFVNQF